jgi:transmembrane sensor
MNGTGQREMSAIREAAVDWVVRLNGQDLTADQKTDFMAWLRRSPTHVKEYLHAEAAWQAMGGAVAGDATSIEDLARQIEPKVASLPGLRTAAVARRPHIAVWSLGAAALVLIGLVAVFFVSQKSGDYSTRLGEIRRVTLPDGSIMELNTQSQARVTITADFREVVLEKGEAFFAVAKDSARPFRVKSGAVLVRALGTQFNVYRQSESTRVAVVEGRVAVEQAGSKSIELSAGNTVDLGLRQPVQRVATHANSAAAWRQHRLVFENETLATVVGEFNRYNSRQLAIESPELGAKRISGVFKPDRPDALVDFLTQTSGVKVEQDSDERIVLVTEVGGQISDSSRLQ